MLLEAGAHVSSSLTYVVLLAFRALDVINYATLALYGCGVLGSHKLVAYGIDRFVIRWDVVVLKDSAEIL